MTVAELIDQLLEFELNEKISYLNLVIGGKEIKKTVNLFTDDEKATIWYERTGENPPKGEAAGVPAKAGE